MQELEVSACNTSLTLIRKFIVTISIGNKTNLLEAMAKM